jgi:hypothetical protein
MWYSIFTEFGKCRLLILQSVGLEAGQLIPILSKDRLEAS